MSSSPFFGFAPGATRGPPPGFGGNAWTDDPGAGPQAFAAEGAPVGAADPSGGADGAAVAGAEATAGTESTGAAVALGSGGGGWLAAAWRRAGRRGARRRAVTVRAQEEHGGGNGCRRGDGDPDPHAGASLLGLDGRCLSPSGPPGRGRRPGARGAVGATIPDTDCACPLPPIALRARSTVTRDAGGANGSSADASSAAFAKRSVGSFLQAALDDLDASPAGTSGRSSASDCGGSVTTLRHSSGIVSASNGHRPREQLEEDDAERPDVGARVDVARRAHLLGRHVERRAEHRPRLREAAADAAAGARDRLGDAEVEHLHARARRRPCARGTGSAA